MYKNADEEAELKMQQRHVTIPVSRKPFWNRLGITERTYSVSLDSFYDGQRRFVGQLLNWIKADGGFGANPSPFNPSFPTETVAGKPQETETAPTVRRLIGQSNLYRWDYPTYFFCSP